MKPPLLLASASPRRHQLLQQAGVALTALACDVDERPWPDEDPVDHAQRLACAKVLAARGQSGQWVLAADTVVHRDGRLFGKPGSDVDARRMLGELAGGWHKVTTAFALARDGAIAHRQAVTTKVRFRALGDDDLARYVASGEPRDKAGGYGIQGEGGALVDQVHGSYTCVIGLPLPEVMAALRALGALDQDPA